MSERYGGENHAIRFRLYGMRLFEPTETEDPFSASCRGYCPPSVATVAFSETSCGRILPPTACRHLRGIPDGQNRPTPRNNIPAADAAGIIHANGGCTLAARGRDMCRTRSRGRKGRTTYINAGNRPILHVRAGKDTGCGSPDFVTDFRNTTASSPRGGCCLL